MTLEDIYRNNYPIVFGYLLSLGADHHVAEELTAETFLRAIQYANRYDGSCKPSTWLCAIGKNLYFNERKRQKRRASLDETMYAASDSPEDRYIQTEQAKLALSAARQLDSPYREVFFLRLNGLSFQNIGATLEQTENWARVTYFRAKTKILTRMEDHHGAL